MKLPALQFYPGDWRKDPGVQSLSYFDRGVWFEILCLMHESSDRGKLLLNGQPMPDDALATILGLDKQILTTTLNTLLTYGVASRDDKTGALVNRRMVKDETLRHIRTEAGKKGGNPALVKQRPTKARASRQAKPNQEEESGDKQIPTPSSSSSIVSSEEKKERRATRPPRDPRLDHPAMCAVIEVKGSYPNKDTWDLVIKVVGVNPNIELLRECWVTWRSRNYAPGNLGWLTDWYINGIPGARNGTNQKRLESGPERNVRNLQENAAYIRGLQDRSSEGDREDPIGVLTSRT